MARCAVHDDVGTPEPTSADDHVLNAVEEHDPDIVVTDVRMPHINGVDLCHALRKKYKSETVFVALTAHVFSQEKEQLLEEGFNRILTKPFREEELMHLFGLKVRNEKSADQEHQTNGSIALDLSMLKKITMGDEALLQSIMLQFQEETAADVQRLATALNTRNSGSIREVVHKLSGRVGQMGAMQLSADLHEIENELVEGTAVESILDKVVAAKVQVSTLLESIRAYTLQQSN